MHLDQQNQEMSFGFPCFWVILLNKFYKMLNSRMLSDIYSINVKTRFANGRYTTFRCLTFVNPLTLRTCHLGKPFRFLCNKKPKLRFKLCRDFALKAVRQYKCTSYSACEAKDWCKLKCVVLVEMAFQTPKKKIMQPKN